MSGAKFWVINAHCFISRYHSLIRATDGKEYAKENFVDMRVEKFTFLIVSKLYEVPQDWKDTFYVIKIVTPAMS